MEGEPPGRPRTGGKGPPEFETAPGSSPAELSPVWRFLHLSLVGLGLMIVIAAPLREVGESGPAYALGRLGAVLVLTALIRFLFVWIVDRSTPFWTFSLVGIAVLLTILSSFRGAMERGAEVQDSRAREWVAPASAFVPLDNLSYGPVAPGLADDVKRSFASEDDVPAPKTAVRALRRGRTRVAIVVALSFPPSTRSDLEGLREGFFRGFVASARKPTSPLVEPQIKEIEIDGGPAILVVTESVSVALAFTHADLAVEVIGPEARAVRDAAAQLVSNSRGR